MILVMDKESYKKLKSLARGAMREDRKCFRKAVSDAQYSDAIGGTNISFNPVRHKAVIAGLSERDLKAVLSKEVKVPVRRLGISNPKIDAFYVKGGMTLNKRVALRRALKQIKEKFYATV